MVINPTGFGFSAEYVSDHPAHFDGFDEYVREELASRDPDWDCRFGKASIYDPSEDRDQYVYLLTGNVPHAESHADAEKKVQELLARFEQRLKSIGAAAQQAAGKRRIKIWKW